MTPLRSLVVVVTAALLLGACAHAPPAELVDARTAYAVASRGTAATLVPAELHKAAEALKAAETAFEDEPKSYHTRDLAYVAHRKAQLAVALASVAGSEAASEQARADYDRLQTAMLSATEAQLADSEAVLSATRGALSTTAADLAHTSASLSAAEQGKADADARAAAATAELAAAKEEARGLVITLSGSVLFRSDESTLLPEAQTRLNQVADALLTKPARALVVEGHTDSRGTDADNLALSQRRGDAVRTYLVGRGYSAALIQANGIGEARPIADNATPEGMSNNRRVEIVITKP